MAVLVLSYNQYKFADQSTGEIREGITIQVAEEPVFNSNAKGLQVTKISAPLEALKEIQQVPAYYDVEYSIRPGAGGKAQLVYRSANFVKPLMLDFSSVPVAQK